MLQVLFIVTPLFGLVLMGYVSAKLRPIPLESLGWLNFFIVYLALPALFFQLLSTTPVAEFANVRFLFCALLATACVFWLCFFIAKAFTKANRQEAGIQGFAGAYGNIGYMGPPLAISALGPEAGVPVALIFCLENVLHFTLAPILLSANTRAEPATQHRAVSVFFLVLQLIKKPITHPFILATIAGITVAALNIEIAAPIDTLLSYLSQAAAPCALFAMGITAALKPLKRVPMELSYLLPIKLIVHPLVVYLAVAWIPGVPLTWVYAAVLLAALPTATNVFVLAQQYHTWEERASSTVILSTFLSTLTVTLIVYVLQSAGH